MDYYQGVVFDYLRADRAIFINTECTIQIKPGEQPPKGTSWECDAIALDLRSHTVFLCEITYAPKFGALVKRLKDWCACWSEIQEALIQDCKVDDQWPVRVWLFVPEKEIPALVARLELFKNGDDTPIFAPRITSLESVEPWKYRIWNHQDANTPRPDCVPAAMRL